MESQAATEKGIAPVTGTDGAVNNTSSAPSSVPPQSSGSNEKDDANKPNTPKSDTPAVVSSAEEDSDATVFKPDYRFWVILGTLAILIFLATLENTIIGTALPEIVRDLDIGNNYVWVAHIQLLTG